jgi:hypothetical protein
VKLLFNRHFHAMFITLPCATRAWRAAFEAIARAAANYLL